ncbi:MAG: glycoside hydrolase family 99-like domain-containing protein [Gammaproteobacteria bacterium]|nr:glycoside hydrolase family 99-like domain-containing protein [Gammaproteobacteria bacterium]
MSFNRSFQHGRVKRKLRALYACILQDIEHLNRIQLSLDELILSSEEDGLPDVSKIPELANWIACVSTPSKSYLESIRSRLGLLGQHTIPHRRQALSAGQSLTEHLDLLRSRIAISDAAISTAEAGRSRLRASVDYYEMVLTDLAWALEPMRHGRGKKTSGKQVRALLREASTRVQRYASIPQPAIDQYCEHVYLAENPDVSAAISRRSYVSGLHHFVSSGLDEMRAKTRPLGSYFSKICESTDARAYGLVFEENSSGSTNDDFAEAAIAIKQSGLFDEHWYLSQYFCAVTSSANAILHYVEFGEAAGCWPNEWFDPRWYADQHGISCMGGASFAHYVEQGNESGLNPNELFDVAHYGSINSDLQGHEIHLVSHFYSNGWREGRDPSALFSLAEYAQKAMYGDPLRNPLTHAINVRRSASIFANAIEANVLSNASRGEAVEAKRAAIHARHAHTMDSDGTNLQAGTDEMAMELPDIANNIRYFANPGPSYEKPGKAGCESLDARAKAIAFYLPQFYEFEQNNEWWGDGFTEWRNVSRGTPRYCGHYQPRIPRDLGFYDLTNPDTLRAQAELAKNNGVEAFCFYYYWFNGTRLMDKPLDLFVNSDIDQEFCIMWANENWTRTWDGFESEVLIRQDYNDEDEDAFIADTSRYFMHERYTRVAGRPLFILYRPGLLPDANNTIARWKHKWTEQVGVTPWVIMVRGFGDTDPRSYELDGAIEFPPHKVAQDTPDINDQLTILDPEFAGHIRAYSDVVDASLSEETPDYPLIKTVSPHWDNDARREGRGMTLHGSTPDLYEKWLRGAIDHAVAHPFEGEPLVFINAWNEWAEGAYLEPDVHYGHAYLNATKRAVHNLTRHQERMQILLVGHDANPHGAQMLLLSYAQVYKEQFGLEVVIALKSGGPLLKEYQKYGQTIVLEQFGHEELIRTIKTKQLNLAICNTTVTGDLVPLLKDHGLAVVSLIHELPNLITEYQLTEHVKAVADAADHVVFAADVVKSGFESFAPKINGDVRIMPQGSYKRITFDERSRSQLRAELGVKESEKLVLNVGYADLRKGFDLFLQSARQLCAQDSSLHFVWVGALSAEMDRWVKTDLGQSDIDRRIHLVGFSDRVSDYYSACDTLFLTSREDPYPTVVLEAMAVGVPVVLFKKTTGFDSLISEYGYIADRTNPTSISEALHQALFVDTDDQKVHRANYVDQHCRFDDYVFDILKLLQPKLEKISVVVPNYNYDQYIASRLQSVFGQTYPIFETIVLDDYSSDRSLKVIKKVASETDRQIQLVPSSSNSGNTFKQWRKGLELARGDYVWIAEADDLSDSTFVAELMGKFSENTVMSFSDSVQIQTNGDVLADSYDYYYKTVDADLFATDFQLPGSEFVRRALSVKNVILNVSAVVWRRAALAQALDNIGDELTDYKLVGDWRLYMEVLLSEGNSIAYVSDALNTHRRHQGSVTHQMDYQAHLAEIQAIHQLVAEKMEISPELRSAIDSYVEELRVQFGLQDVETPDTEHSKAA